MFLSMVDVSLGRSTFIIVCLTARPFAGSIGKADAPPVFLLTRLSQPPFCTLLFILKRCISISCMSSFSGFSSVSNPDIYLRVPLRSWGFPFFLSMSPTFLEGFRSCREISNHSHAVWIICPIQLYWVSPLLLMGLISPRSSVGGIFDIFVPYSPCFLWEVSKDLGSTASLSWAVSLEVFSQPSVIVVPWQIRSLQDASLLSDGIFLGSHICSFSVRRIW